MPVMAARPNEALSQSSEERVFVGRAVICSVSRISALPVNGVPGEIGLVSVEVDKTVSPKFIEALDIYFSVLWPNNEENVHQSRFEVGVDLQIEGCIPKFLVVGHTFVERKVGMLQHVGDNYDVSLCDAAIAEFIKAANVC